MSTIEEVLKDNYDLDKWFLKQTNREKYVYRHTIISFCFLILFISFAIGFYLYETNFVHLIISLFVYYYQMFFMILIFLITIYSVFNPILGKNHSSSENRYFTSGVSKEIFYRKDPKDENEIQLFSRYIVHRERNKDDKEDICYFSAFDFNLNVFSSTEVYTGKLCKENRYKYDWCLFLFTKENTSSAFFRFFGTLFPPKIETLCIYLNQETKKELYEKCNLYFDENYNEFIDKMFINLEKQDFAKNLLEGEDNYNEWNVKRYRIF